MELLAPAGSPEAVTAAVQSGADAIYCGFGDFNARRNAANFSLEEFGAAVSYCHLRGVKVYLTLNTLLNGRELVGAASAAAQARDLGVDAVLVQDLGVARVVRDVAPDLPLHASTQMSVHSLDGALEAHDLGMTRVVLARELPAGEIETICRRAPVEVEVFVHGALCMCYSGQCFFSALVGGRSGNRGLCAQPCRLNYGWGDKADRPLLSLKDMSLTGHLQALEDMGVACVKIEGRMKRPEYVAVVTEIYAAAMHEHREPTAEEVRALEQAFSRQGFTDGYFMGRTGREMFGVRQAQPAPPEALFAAARQRYGRETPRVPVTMDFSAPAGGLSALTVADGDGHAVTLPGPAAEPARTRPLDPEKAEAQLAKTGGTPFYAEQVTARVGEGLTLPLSALNALRRQGLEALSARRTAPPERRKGSYIPPKKAAGQSGPPVFTLSLASAAQLTPELIAARPALVALPLEEAAAHPETGAALAAGGIEAAVVLPRILWTGERGEAVEQLNAAKAAGFTSAYAGELGGLRLARAQGFVPRGDFGIGIANGLAAEELARLDCRSVTLSFEQRLSQLRDLPKGADSEAIVYGRLPMMITENCIVKNRTGGCTCRRGQSIVDRKGVSFPVVRAWGCRNEILNSAPLWLADKKADWTGIGLWGARLRFTTEEPEECAAILRAYQAGEAPPEGPYTRGLYYRGVE